MSERNKVIIKSIDSPAILSFTPLRWYEDKIGSETKWFLYFKCAYSDGNFSAEVNASTYLVDSVSEFFEDMALSWRGWTGKKQWNDCDGRVILSATSDSLGHVNLEVRLTSYGPPDRKIETTLSLEAGGLDRIAKGTKSIFERRE